MQISKEKVRADTYIKQALGTLQKASFDINNGKMDCRGILQGLNSIIGMTQKARKEIFMYHCNECLSKDLKKDKAQALKMLESLYNKD